MLKEDINKAYFIFKNKGLSGVSKKGRNRAVKFIRNLKKDTSVTNPESFMIEVTNLCNLKCITCPREYEYGSKMNKGSIDIAKFKKVIDEIAPYAKSIGLTGLGETLLYKHLSEAVDYIHAKIEDPDIFISTNANLPKTKELLQGLSDRISTVQISIDGVHSKYDEIRIKGNYSKFIENVKSISNIKNTDFIFNMVVFKNNYEQMSDVVEVASEAGIKKVQFNAFNLASVTSHDIDDYKLYSSDKFIHEYNKAVKLAEKLKIGFNSFFDFETEPGFKKCMYPWSGFYITWDGYLVPCCTKPFPLELNFGNVFEDGVMNCLNSDSYRQFRKAWYENEAPAFCNRCQLIVIPKVDINKF